MKCENCGGGGARKIKDTDVKICEECDRAIGKGWNELTKGLIRRKKRIIKKQVQEHLQKQEQKKRDKEAEGKANGPVR